MAVTTTPVARQARSRRTQEQILDASFALIAEGGIEALTINAISERAGVAVGSVYRRFGDKDRLLMAVQKAFAEQVRDDVSARLSSHQTQRNAAPEAVVANVVAALTESFRKNEAVLRVFLVLGLQNGDMYAAGSRASQESRAMFVQHLQEIDVRRTDPEAALDFAFRLIYSVLAHRVTQGEFLESDRPLSWSDLQQHLTDTVTTYLLAP